MNMFLTGEELRMLTGKKQRKAQVKALNKMLIQHVIRPDGMPLVSRAGVETMLDGSPKVSLESVKEFNPNWGAIDYA